jgi:hypothetical protein
LRRKTVTARLLALLFAAFAFPYFAYAQANLTPSRITQAVDEANLTTLLGNTHPLAQTPFDRGAAPDALPTDRMLLVLKRSPSQEAALDTLLDQQADRASPNYHAWLTPQQFGQQFGPSDADIQTITAWLQSHGFQVNGVSNGRTVIEFSGNAGQMRDAFHTSIHRYTVNGEDHWANSSDPQIPAALAPVVSGIATLYNFPRQAMHEVMGTFLRSRSTGAVQLIGPLFTIPLRGFTYFALGPADFAKIYNVPNLLRSPAPSNVYNGDGQTVAIVGQSDINPQDVNAFRTLFGLPTLANLTTIVSGPDPGFDPGGAETEADLDVEWAGAVAPNAAIDLVIAQSTEVSLGVDLAAQYAVDNNVAPVLNESFGICEFFLGASGNTFYDQLWQQAAAQGITVTVSSGDTGSATCDRAVGTVGPALYGLSVSGFTSTPYNVSVGGTDFNDITDFAEFWNTTQSDTPTVPSALGYIPEMTWNGTCTNQEIFSHFDVTTAEQSCNNATIQQDGYTTLRGGSGGQSNCTVSGSTESSCSGGYAKPTWQVGTGVPNDGARDIPDVSLFASAGFNGSLYVICESDLAPVPSTSSCDPYAQVTSFVGIGGTSASSPAFAAIVSLVNQATGSRQGNANYVLYKLAAQPGQSCTSAANPANTCVFYDIPSGSTIAMPCAQGSPNNPVLDSTCPIQTLGDSVGVLSGYSATPGYDLATGLGSVNAANLINEWQTFGQNLKPTATTLALNNNSAVNITHGQSVPVTVTVEGGGGTPSGNVSLIANTGTGAEQGVGSAPLVNGTASFSTNSLPGGNDYTVLAQYSGDGTFNSSDSPSQTVTVGPEASKLQLAYELFDPATGLLTNPNAASATFGTPSLLRINVASQASDACAQNGSGNIGCPSGDVQLTDASNSGAPTPLDGGIYVLNSQGYAEDQVISLFPGTYQLNGSYPGDNSYDASSGSAALTISKAPVTLTVSAANGLLGVTVATNSYATAAGDLPTGTVQFFVNGTAFQIASAVSGSVNNQTGAAQASVGISFSPYVLPIGQDNITAQYSGDANYAAASVSNSVSVSVVSPTATSVTATNPTLQQGSSIVLTATVSPLNTNGPGPAGTVQFNLSSASGTSLGTATLSGGQASLTTSSIPTGTFTVYATYSGNASYLTSSGSVTQTTVLPASTIMVTSSSLTPVAASPVTLTAQVAPTLSGGPTLTGSVVFSASSPYGAYIDDLKQLANGQAQDTFSLWSGSDIVTVSYSGDPNYAPSTTKLTETVIPIGTTMALTSSAPTSQVGMNVTFTAAIIPTQSGGPTPSGGVVFSENGSPLPAVGTQNGQAVLTTSALAAGTYAISASFSGDPDHSGSSASTNEVVTPGRTTTALSSSNSTITRSSVVTFTAQVNPPNSGAPVPTGSVQFTANGSSIGIVRLENGSAQIFTSSLPTGAIPIVANYSGDSDYVGSAGTVTETVTGPPTFTVTANPAAVTIASPGQSSSTALTFTSVSGFTGSGDLTSSTCGTSASEEITCTLSAFTLPANGTATATLRFMTTAASSVSPAVRNPPPRDTKRIDWGPSRYFIPMCLLCLASFAVAARRNERRFSLASAALVFVVLTSGAACGGGGSGSSAPGNLGTPMGPVQPLNVSVTVNGTNVQVPDLTVTVQ